MVDDISDEEREAMFAALMEEGEHVTRRLTSENMARFMEDWVEFCETQGFDEDFGEQDVEQARKRRAAWWVWMKARYVRRLH